MLPCDVTGEGGVQQRYNTQLCWHAALWVFVKKTEEPLACDDETEISCSQTLEDQQVIPSWTD